MEYIFKMVPEVKLVHITPEPEKYIAQAGAKCYRSKPKNYDKFVRARVKDKHYSLGRHVIAMFEVWCSRACSMQLLRSKFIEPHQESQRYVKANPVFHIPPKTTEFQKRGMEMAYNMYEKAILVGLNKEDARYSLPESTETSLVLSGNFQGWRDFIKLRDIDAAQREIRLIALEVKDILKKEAEAFFYDI